MMSCCELDCMIGVSMGDVALSFFLLIAPTYWVSDMYMIQML